MTTIYNVIESVGGQAQDDISVTVQITWDRTVAPFPHLAAATPTSFEGNLEVDTDQDGRWEADVAGNDVIIPSGSRYKITETEGTVERAVYYVNVLTDVNDVWVGTILATTPAWEA